jgi:transcriptional regulator with XRE-family HTH domain
MSRRSIIAKRLEQVRKRAGISSQAKLGILAGIDESSASTRMNYYAKGTNEPNLQTLTRIAAVVKTPVPYFYCEDDRLAELILKFGSLDEAQRNRLLEFADKL